MKVFLSHSTKDADFVKQLAAAITGAGSEPWLCEVDVEKHENFLAEIEKGLKRCDVALRIWSPDAADSKWTEEEWTSVLHCEVTEFPPGEGLISLSDNVGGVKFSLERTSASAFEKAPFRSRPHAP